MNVVWQEFPGINRKVAFQFNYASAGISIGCHCGSISGVQAYFGNSYYAACGGRNIEVLDKEKEKQFRYSRDDYNEMWKPPKEELDKVIAHFKEVDLKFSDICVAAYPQIVEKCKSVPLWVMSDVINYDAPVRKIPTGSMGKDILYEAYGSTREFAKYLIDNKIGYMLASPIVQNPSHRVEKNYSLNQAWFWVHPAHLIRSIDVAEAHGADQFPSQEQWIKTVGEDLDIKDSEVLKSVLNTGVFPEDKRFKRSQLAKVAEA